MRKRNITCPSHHHQMTKWSWTYTERPNYACKIYFKTFGTNLHALITLLNTAEFNRFALSNKQPNSLKCYRTFVSCKQWRTFWRYNCWCQEALSHVYVPFFCTEIIREVLSVPHIRALRWHQRWRPRTRMAACTSSNTCTSYQSLPQSFACRSCKRVPHNRSKGVLWHVQLDIPD